MTTTSAEVGDTVADVLRAAYYYCLVDGHRVVEPGMVLVAAARNDDTISRPVLGAAVAEARSRLRPGNAAPYLPSACRHAPALREAGWWVCREAAGEPRDSVPAWADTLCAALDRAAAHAHAAGAGRLGVTHLLRGVLDEGDPSTRSLALDVPALCERLGAMRPETSPRPFAPLVDLITPFGAVAEKEPLLVRWVPRMVARFATRVRHWGGPVMPGLEAESLRQAVRCGHRQVDTGAVLLAAMSLDDQLEATGRRLKQRYVPHNRAGRVLAAAGVGFGSAGRAAESLGEEGEHLSAAQSAERFWGTGKPGDPPWGRAAARVADRAASIAEQRGHTDVGTSHLLAAVLDEPESSGQRLLTALGADLADLRRRVEESLAGT